MDIHLNPALLAAAAPQKDRAINPPADHDFHQVLAAADASSRDSGKIGGAAKQFEALMLLQIMKAARASSDGGWLGTGEDQAGQLAVEMAEQQFAQAMTAHDGLGIAKLVTAGLEHRQIKAASSGSPGAAQAAPASTDSKQ